MSLKYWSSNHCLLDKASVRLANKAENAIDEMKYLVRMTPDSISSICYQVTYLLHI